MRIDIVLRPQDDGRGQHDVGLFEKINAEISLFMRQPNLSYGIHDVTLVGSKAYLSVFVAAPEPPVESTFRNTITTLFGCGA